MILHRELEDSVRSGEGNGKGRDKVSDASFSTNDDDEGKKRDRRTERVRPPPSTSGSHCERREETSRVEVSVASFREPVEDETKPKTH